MIGHLNQLIGDIAVIAYEHVLLEQYVSKLCTVLARKFQLRISFEVGIGVKLHHICAECPIRGIADVGREGQLKIMVLRRVVIYVAVHQWLEIMPQGSLFAHTIQRRMVYAPVNDACMDSLSPNSFVKPI